MEDFQMKQNQPRRTYLVTYSQADLNSFPNRKGFGKIVKDAFNASNGKVKVQHWACSMEDHKEGGKHYHACLKLSGPKRWKTVKESIQKEHKIVLNFSDHHDNYYSAYKYVSKSDVHVYHSKHHPDLENVSSPRTKLSTQAYRRSRKRASIERAQETANSSSSNSASSTNNKLCKPKRLSNLNVSEFVLKNNITTEIKLLASAQSRKSEGQTDLANFVLSKNPKALSELIATTWKMQNASVELERQDAKRMDIIRNTSNSTDCVDACEERWLKCAKQVLEQNGVHPFVFSAAMRDLLIHGRSKFRNIMLVGPTNCGKSFLLKPLENIFKAFVNPANDKYAWVNSQNAEIILLQDIRWSSELIPWDKFLLLLEGETVKLPSPKNQYAEDVCISSDVPIFATSKAKIEYVGKFNSRDDRETEMMTVRWKVFEFPHSIPQAEVKEIPPCPRCFCELVLLGELPTAEK